MDSSTTLGQETPTERSDVPPASSFPETRNPMEANNPLEASVLPKAGSHLFRAPKGRFPLEAQLSFRSALRRGRLASFLLERIRNFYAGNSEGLPEAGIVRPISQKVYNELNDLLEEDEQLEKWASRQMKIVHIAERQKLSYDTPNAIHKTIIEGVSRMICDQLEDINEKWQMSDVSGKHQSTLAEEIESRGSTRIPLRNSKGYVTPDRNWIFTGDNRDRSCFVLEVANSEQYYHVKHKAFTMISKGSGHPGMVLIIWVKSNEPDAKEVDKTAGFTIISLRKFKQTDDSIKLLVDQIESKKIIRDAKGKVQEGSIYFTINDMLGVKNEEFYEQRKNSNDPVVATYTAGILDAKIELSYAAIAGKIKAGERTEAYMRIPDDSSDDEDISVAEVLRHID
ncbi:hypothetical protein DIS24_g9873 [Lasiodiplodia hormozganensis]|uniref:Uncharacterized protein n=1 Tax=Lasiodiplodia hormozganensis TaxID=869390 RepID=A0AA40CI51_9PEZI|nr:hypothetical protein DIS24_g9873 [Lasiodiplodia hormozganensis]